GGRDTEGEGERERAGRVEHWALSRSPRGDCVAVCLSSVAFWLVVPRARTVTAPLSAFTVVVTMARARGGGARCVPATKQVSNWRRRRRRRRPASDTATIPNRARAQESGCRG